MTPLIALHAALGARHRRRRTALALAVWFIRRGNVRAHKGFMIGTFLGLVGAGLGALAPGRALARLFF